MVSTGTGPWRPVSDAHVQASGPVEIPAQPSKADIVFAVDTSRSMRATLADGLEAEARKFMQEQLTGIADRKYALLEFRDYNFGAPGPQNPMGARALYLFEGNKDTLYGIHGTNQPEYIGEAISSGCIRLTNEDIIDLYNRVKPGAVVVVLAPHQGHSPFSGKVAAVNGLFD